MTTATAAKKTTATVKPTAKKQPITVTPRRLARDFGAGKKGHVVLILNPAKFGSTGDNWLNGKSYVSRAEAVAAAAKAGVKIAS